MVTKVRKELTRRKIRRAIHKLPSEGKRELLEEVLSITPALDTAKEALRPGEHIESDRKKSWTYKDMEQFPRVQFMSEETVLVTWNGLRYQLITGAVHDLPLPIRDAYFNHRKELRDAGKSLPTDTGFVTEVFLGAGALEPEG